MARSGRVNSTVLIPWAGALAFTQPRTSCASSSSSGVADDPARFRRIARASHSAVEKRQLRTWPSAVRRRRSQAPQKGCETGGVRAVRARAAADLKSGGGWVGGGGPAGGGGADFGFWVLGVGVP